MKAPLRHTVFKFLGVGFLALVMAGALALLFRPVPLAGSGPQYATVTELVVPPSWAGEWEITAVYRNGATDQIFAVDRITDFIRAHEPVGLAQFADVAICSGAISDEGIQFYCAVDVTLPTCTVTGAWDLVGQLSGDALTGSAAWTENTFGQCGPLLTTRSETIEFTGVRLSQDQGTDQPSSLVAKFVPHPLLVVAAPCPVTFVRQKLEIEDDEFELKGKFALGACSDGIDPLTEPMSLQVGSFAATIPAGSFKRKRGEYKFEGYLNDIPLELKITQLRNGNYEIKVEAERVDLTSVANPVTVGLIIGDDSASAAVTAEFDDDNRQRRRR